MSKFKSTLFAGALAPLMLLAGCSGTPSDGQAHDAATTGANGAATPGSTGTAGGGSTGGGTGTATAGGGGGQQSAAPQRDATKDVKLDTCAVKDGVATVAATITNSAKATENYVIAVEVQQGGKRVDGVALLATVDAGKSAKSQMDGTKSDLKGKVTCKVTSVQTMGG